MERIGKARFARNVGELRAALADIPDATLFFSMDDDPVFTVEIWELKEDQDTMSYEEESYKDVPDFIRVTIETDGGEDVYGDD